MAKFRKKPIVIEATQWLQNGDHPNDESVIMTGPTGDQFLSEGKVVRRYRVPNIQEHDLCTCGRRMYDHGWIDEGLKGYIVCPGNYVVTDENGEYYPVSAKEFNRMYELCENQQSITPPYEDAINAFANSMMYRMETKRSEKSGWESESPKFHLIRLQEMVHKLWHRLKYGASDGLVVDAAADVANHAMMICYAWSKKGDRMLEDLKNDT